MRKSVARAIQRFYFTRASLREIFLRQTTHVLLLCFSLHCYTTIDSIMDYRSAILLCLAALLAMLVLSTEGRNKKVVIHVPYKVKKIKHTHMVYKTIHHHHKHRDPHMDHGFSATEEHEHFHHMHIHDEPPVGQHSQPVPGIGIPEFLPDVPLDVPLEIPDVPPHEIPGLPSRHIIPLYRRN